MQTSVGQQPAHKHAQPSRMIASTSALNHIWEETALNGAHPAPSLVIRQLKISSCSTASVAKALFAECKGRSIRNGSERTPEILLEFFNHANESVRLSACWVAVKEWVFNDMDLLRCAITTLVKISISSRETRHKEEAFALLREVRSLNPFTSSMVKMVETQEKHRFAAAETGDYPVLTDCIMPIAPADYSEGLSSEVCSDQVERPIAVDLRSFVASSQRLSAATLPRTAFFQRYSN